MQTGSITGAARLLNLSQPSVTKHIQTLEALIASELFVRDGRGIVATPTAMTMYEDVHALFDQANNIYRIMESVSRTSKRRIRVGMPPVLGSRFIADVFSRLDGEHEDFVLNVVEKDSAILKIWITSGRLDLAVVTEHVSGSGLSIGNSPMVCIMPVGHPLAHRPHVTPADLMEHDYVAYESDSPVQTRIDQALRETSLKIYPKVVASTTPTLVELVGVGAGISVVHPFALINAHSPVETRPFAPIIPWSYRLISSSTLRNSLLVSEFMDKITQAAADWLERLAPMGAPAQAAADIRDTFPTDIGPPEI
jgi:DNA-binding transcriptional LysR family regulator